MTMNVVFEAKTPQTNGATRTQCLEQAKKWLTPTTKFANGTEVRRWLSNGAAKIEDLAFKQIEVNVQAARLPSEIKTDMGGQADYIQRILRPISGKLEPVLLENTPDVAKITSDAALKAELVQWIVDNIATIDLGTHRIPEKFLTKNARSFTTFGGSSPRKPEQTANIRFSNLRQSRLFTDPNVWIKAILPTKHFTQNPGFLHSTV